MGGTKLPRGEGFSQIGNGRRLRGSRRSLSGLIYQPAQDKRRLHPPAATLTNRAGRSFFLKRGGEALLCARRGSAGTPEGAQTRHGWREMRHGWHQTPRRNYPTCARRTPPTWLCRGAVEGLGDRVRWQGCWRQRVARQQLVCAQLVALLGVAGKAQAATDRHCMWCVWLRWRHIASD